MAGPDNKMVFTSEEPSFFRNLNLVGWNVSGLKHSSIGNKSGFTSLKSFIDEFMDYPDYEQRLRDFIESDVLNFDLGNNEQSIISSIKEITESMSDIRESMRQIHDKSTSLDKNSDAYRQSLVDSLEKIHQYNQCIFRLLPFKYSNLFSSMPNNGKNHDENVQYTINFLSKLTSTIMASITDNKEMYASLHEAQASINASEVLLKQQIRKRKTGEIENTDTINDLKMSLQIDDLLRNAERHITVGLSTLHRMSKKRNQLPKKENKQAPVISSGDKLTVTVDNVSKNTTRPTSNKSQKTSETKIEVTNQTMSVPSNRDTKDVEVNTPKTIKKGDHGKKNDVDTQVDNPTRSEDTQVDNPTRSEDTQVDNPTRSEDTQVDNPTRSEDTQVDNPTRSEDTQVDNPTRSEDTQVDNPTRSEDTQVDNPTRSEDTQVDNPTRSEDTQVDNPTRSEDTQVDNPTRSEDTQVDSPTRSEDTQVDNPTRSEDTQVDSPTRSEDTQVDNPTRSEDTQVDNPTRSEDTQVDNPTRSEDTQVDSPTRSEDTQVDSPTRSKGIQVSPTRSEDTQVDNPTRSKGIQVSPTRSEDTQVDNPTRSKGIQVSPTRSEDTQVDNPTRSEDTQVDSPTRSEDTQVDSPTRSEGIQVSPTRSKGIQVGESTLEDFRSMDSNIKDAFPSRRRSFQQRSQLKDKLSNSRSMHRPTDFQGFSGHMKQSSINIRPPINYNNRLPINSVSLPTIGKSRGMNLMRSPRLSTASRPRSKRSSIGMNPVLFSQPNNNRSIQSRSRIRPSYNMYMDPVSLSAESRYSRRGPYLSEPNTQFYFPNSGREFIRKPDLYSNMNVSGNIFGNYNASVIPSFPPQHPIQVLAPMNQDKDILKEISKLRRENIQLNAKRDLDAANERTKEEKRRRKKLEKELDRKRNIEDLKQVFQSNLASSGRLQPPIEEPNLKMFSSFQPGPVDRPVRYPRPVPKNTDYRTMSRNTDYNFRPRSYMDSNGDPYRNIPDNYYMSRRNQRLRREPSIFARSNNLNSGDKVAFKMSSKPLTDINIPIKSFDDLNAPKNKSNFDDRENILSTGIVNNSGLVEGGSNIRNLMEEDRPKENLQDLGKSDRGSICIGYKDFPPSNALDKAIDANFDINSIDNVGDMKALLINSRTVFGASDLILVQPDDFDLTYKMKGSKVDRTSAKLKCQSGIYVDMDKANKLGFEDVSVVMNDGLSEVKRSFDRNSVEIKGSEPIILKYKWPADFLDGKEIVMRVIPGKKLEIIRKDTEFDLSCLRKLMINNKSAYSCINNEISLIDMPNEETLEGEYIANSSRPNSRNEEVDYGADEKEPDEEELDEMELDEMEPDEEELDEKELDEMEPDEEELDENKQVEEKSGYDIVDSANNSSSKSRSASASASRRSASASRRSASASRSASSQVQKEETYSDSKISSRRRTDNAEYSADDEYSADESVENVESDLLDLHPGDLIEFKGNKYRFSGESIYPDLYADAEANYTLTGNNSKIYTKVCGVETAFDLSSIPPYDAQKNIPKQNGFFIGPCNHRSALFINDNKSDRSAKNSKNQTYDFSTMTSSNKPIYDTIHIKDKAGDEKPFFSCNIFDNGGSKGRDCNTFDINNLQKKILIHAENKWHLISPNSGNNEVSHSLLRKKDAKSLVQDGVSTINFPSKSLRSSDMDISYRGRPLFWINSTAKSSYTKDRERYLKYARDYDKGKINNLQLACAGYVPNVYSSMDLYGPSELVLKEEKVSLSEGCDWEKLSKVAKRKGRDNIVAFSVPNPSGYKGNKDKYAIIPGDYSYVQFSRMTAVNPEVWVLNNRTGSKTKVSKKVNSEGMPLMVLDFEGRGPIIAVCGRVYKVMEDSQGGYLLEPVQSKSVKKNLLTVSLEATKVMEGSINIQINGQDISINPLNKFQESSREHSKRKRESENQKSREVEALGKENSLIIASAQNTQTIDKPCKTPTSGNDVASASRGNNSRSNSHRI